MEDKFPLLLMTLLLLVSFFLFVMQLEAPNEQFDVHESIKQTLSLQFDSPIVESKTDVLSAFAKGTLTFLPSSSVYLHDSRQLTLLHQITKVPPSITVPSEWHPVLGRSWSLIAWVRAEQAEGAVVTKRRSTRGPVCWEMSASGGLFYGAHSSLLTSTKDAGPSFTPIVTNGNWHHVGIVVEDMGIRFFLDGAMVGESSLDIPVTDCEGYLMIGESFKGSLADVRFYPRTVDASQMAQITSIGMDLSAVVRGEAPAIMASTENKAVPVAEKEEKTIRHVIDHTSQEFQRLLTAVKQANVPSAPPMAYSPAVCEDSTTYSNVFGDGCAWFGSDDRCQLGGMEAVRACPLACRTCSVDPPAILAFEFLMGDPAVFAGWNHTCASETGMRRWGLVEIIHDNPSSPLYGSVLGWVLGPELYSSRTGSPPHPRDMEHTRIEARSPQFSWPARGHLEVLFGWGGAGNDVGADEKGFMGVAVVCNGAYVAQTRKPQSGYIMPHTIIREGTMAPFVGQTCEIAVIDDFNGGWGWVSVRSIRVFVEPLDPLLDARVFFPTVISFPPALPAISSSAVRELAVFAWTSRKGRTGALLTKSCEGALAWELRMEVFEYYVGENLEQHRCWPCYDVFSDGEVHNFGFLLTDTGGHFLVDSVVLGSFAAPNFRDCNGSVTVGKDLIGTMYKLQIASHAVSLGRAQEVFHAGVRDGEGQLRAPKPFTLEQKEVVPFGQEIITAGPAIALQVRNIYSECTSTAKHLSRRFSDLLARVCNGTYDCQFAPGYSDGYRCLDRSTLATGTYFGHRAVTFHNEEVFPEFLTTLTDVEIVIRDGELQKTQYWMDLATSKVIVVAPFVTLDHSMLTLCELDLEVVSGVMKAKVSLNTLQPAGGYLVPFCCIFCILFILRTLFTLREWWNMKRIRQIARSFNTEDSELFQGMVNASRGAKITSLILWISGCVTLSLIIQYSVSIGQSETLLGPIVRFDWLSPGENQEKLHEFLPLLSDILRLADRRNRLLIWSFFFSGALLMSMVNSMACHLRLGMIQHTITAMMSDLLNFLAVWLSIFPVFSLTGYFIFGASHPSFATISSAFHTQLLAFVGNWPVEIEEQSAVMVVYWISYIVLTVLLLINFLLAIIVDAYMAMKEGVSDNITELSFLEDVFHVSMYRLYYRLPECLEILARVPVDGPEHLTLDEFTSYWPEGQRQVTEAFSWHVRFFREREALRSFVGPQSVLALRSELEFHRGGLQDKKLGELTLKDFMSISQEEDVRKSRNHSQQIPAEEVDNGNAEPNCHRAPGPDNEANLSQHCDRFSL